MRDETFILFLVSAIPSSMPSPYKSEKWNVSCSVVSDSATPWTLCSPPGSSVHGILQARILEWVTIPFSRGSSPPRDQTQVTHIAHSLYIMLNKYLLNEWHKDWGVICLAGIAIKQIIVELKDMKGGKRELKPKDILSPPCNFELLHCKLWAIQWVKLKIT